jgi:hypothetical protein
MNLLNNVKVITLGGTTGGVGSTGDAGLSTAGAYIANGGFQTASTGIDTSGYGGVMFIATVYGSTISGIHAGFAPNSSAAVTGWTDFSTNAGIFTATSSGVQTLVLDLVKPVQRYVNATVFVGTSSGFINSLTAVLYSPDKAPVAAYSTSIGTNTVSGTTS